MTKLQPTNLSGISATETVKGPRFVSKEGVVLLSQSQIKSQLKLNCFCSCISSMVLLTTNVKIILMCFFQIKN